MNIDKEKQILESKTKILKEIEYRKEIVFNLKQESVEQKGFVCNFIQKILKIKKEAPNLYWKNNEVYGRYLIDADQDLHNDIILAFEKSIDKLQKEYEQIN